MSLFIWALRFWVIFVFFRIIIRGLRNAFIIPSIGEKRSHQFESLINIILILFLFWLLVGTSYVAPSLKVLLLIGITWVFLTFISETLLFYFVLKEPLPVIFYNYRILDGRLNVVVLITMLIAPLFWGYLMKQFF